MTNRRVLTACIVLLVLAALFVFVYEVEAGYPWAVRLLNHGTGIDAQASDIFLAPYPV